MPGWQISLIVIGAGLLALAASVAISHAQAAWRRLTASSA
jgi:hypothetical protein